MLNFCESDLFIIYFTCPLYSDFSITNRHKGVNKLKLPRWFNISHQRKPSFRSIMQKILLKVHGFFFKSHLKKLPVICESFWTMKQL